jgi:hypothetical protein
MQLRKLEQWIGLREACAIGGLISAAAGLGLQFGWWASLVFVGAMLLWLGIGGR